MDHSFVTVSVKISEPEEKWIAVYLRVNFKKAFDLTLCVSVLA